MKQRSSYKCKDPLYRDGHSGISAEMAYRLSLLLGTSAEMWLNLQRDYALWNAKNKFKNVYISRLNFEGDIGINRPPA